MERAGGAAYDGAGLILDIQPNELHQRVAVTLGSADEVARVVAHHTSTEALDAMATIPMAFV